MTTSIVNQKRKELSYKSRIKREEVIRSNPNWLKGSNKYYELLFREEYNKVKPYIEILSKHIRGSEVDFTDCYRNGVHYDLFRCMMLIDLSRQLQQIKEDFHNNPSLQFKLNTIHYLSQSLVITKDRIMFK